MSTAKKLISWEELISKVCQFAAETSANVFSEKQLPMVESRLKRRLSELKLSGPDEYLDYWNNNTASENKIILSLLTTHFTSFFREFMHFEWIGKNLSSIIKNVKAEGRSKITIWSAACSKGQEVWSLAMWFQNQMEQQETKISWEIFGSDIDEHSVKEAMNGVYHKRELETAPRKLWENHWVQGKAELADWYKVKKQIHEKATFGSYNLIDLKMPAQQKFDLIMCRNVLIYFDKTNQSKAVKNMLSHLYPSGVLITGLSESLTGSELDLRSLSPSVYQFKSFVDLLPKVASESKKSTSSPSLNTLPVPLKVFCVDDSPTVIKLLKHLFQDQDFTVVGTASNGQEALEKIPKSNPDVITLDIHMPIMDGLTLVKNSDLASKYPIVVVSSVQRDDQTIIGPLFEKGVKDFVEKPTLENIKIIKEELFQKLKMSWLDKSNKSTALKSDNSSNASTKQKDLPPIYITVNENEASKIFDFTSQNLQNTLTLYFIVDTKIDNLKSTWNLYKNKFSPKSKIISYSDYKNELQPKIWIHTKNSPEEIILKNASEHDFIIAEETNVNSSEIKKIAFDISPLTSIPYLINKYGEVK
ncbi:MAG: CheR family methyltransferase [Bacteriovoracaceae bacterium]|nr:CheR family methyltransferase [Bacteriovoracaceae bacterium]